MPRVELTLSARLDLDELIDYVAMRSEIAADRLVDQFTQLFELLAKHTNVGEDVSNRRVGLRRFTTGNYVVYFETVNAGILIFRVFHAARDHENLL